MSGKCCFEKVPGWWAQSSGYGLWIPLLSVAKDRSCYTGCTYNNIQRIQGTSHWQHQQPYSTLIPDESPSMILEIKEGISRCERGYGPWGIRREIRVSDPGQGTKLSLEKRVLHIASSTKMLMETSNNFSSVSFQMTTRTAQVLFTRFRHYWWNSWNRGSRTSQRSITFLMVVARNIKLLRTSLIYAPLKRTFP